MNSTRNKGMLIGDHPYWNPLKFVVVIWVTLLFLSKIQGTGLSSNAMFSIIPEEKRAQWIATLHNSASSAGAKTEALDSLALLFDPQLLELFKDMAFRSTDKTVSYKAIYCLTSFIRTYRWSEVCDTLADIMLFHPDANTRDSALQALKLTIVARDVGIPYDRNSLVEALITMVSPDTYNPKAHTFFGAVWLLAQIAVDRDVRAIETIQYIRDHFSSYDLTDDITATDAYQSFRQHIDTTYLHWIDSRTLPSLIDSMPDSAETEDYISAVSFMLDSAATDELGLAAIAWLKDYGQSENGDEGKRLAYLYSVAARKRPDRAGQIMPAIYELFPKFNVGIVKHPSTRRSVAHTATAIFNFKSHRLTITDLNLGEKFSIFDLSGRRHYLDYGSSGCRTINFGAGGIQHLIISVNNQAIQTRMWR